MSSIVFCDQCELPNKTDQQWIFVQVGTGALDSLDFCSWTCVGVYAEEAAAPSERLPLEPPC